MHPERFRGLAAESPVFCPWISTGKKCAQITAPLRYFDKN
jgi:hypothetical protein